MNWKHFEKNEFSYQVLFWLLIASIQIGIGSATFIADYQRLNIPLEYWKPIVWESSSQLVGTLLIFVVVKFDQRISRFPFNLRRILIGHLLFSIVFSICHVVGMVFVRKAIYQIMGGEYDFGDWSQELVYEYTKDAYSYFWIILIIYSYRFIVSRLRGEAKLIGVGEDTDLTEIPKRLLVKKIGKEFIIKVKDIEWIEAAGNYMNLHIGKRVYPLRETMGNLETKLNAEQFVRIHRSIIVNLDSVKTIKARETGDFDLELKTGKILKLSRRYREQVKSKLL